MPINCPKGTSKIFRFKPIKRGRRLRLGGCARNNKFIKNGVKEVKVFPKYDPKELKIGIKVEMEHTKSPKVAERIAKDHLREHPNYYTKFVKWEKNVLRKR